MSELRCPYCGRTTSKASKKPWTRQTLAQHVRDAHEPPRVSQPKSLDELFPLTNAIVGDDESDGVFFAVAEWLGEL